MERKVGRGGRINPNQNILFERKSLFNEINKINFICEYAI